MARKSGSPKRLFKFCPIDKEGHTLNNLRNTQLYFSHPEEFNDPFDSKFHVDERCSNEEFREFLIARNQWPTAKPINFTDPIFKEKKRRFEEVHHNPDIPFNSQFNVGVTCFSSSWISNVMWGHYADSHRGICLEFNGYSKTFCSVEKVSYKQNRSRPKMVKTVVQESTFDLETKRALLTKSEEWQYEREWRTFSLTPKSTEKYLPEELLSITVVVVN